MTEQSNTILLSGQDFLSRHPGSTCYRVCSGAVAVYVAPVMGGRIASPKYYCTVQAEESSRAIPSLLYTDENGTHWHLLLHPAGSATLQIISQTNSIVQRKFLSRRGLTGFETYGYEKSLILYYFTDPGRLQPERNFLPQPPAEAAPAANTPPASPAAAAPARQPAAPVQAPAQRRAPAPAAEAAVQKAPESAPRSVPPKAATPAPRQTASVQKPTPAKAASGPAASPAASPAGNICLRSTDVLLTESTLDAYRLEKGQVYVYIVYSQKGRLSQQEYYCTLEEGDASALLPGLNFRDADYRRWQLLLKSAGEEAVLTRIPGGSSEALQLRFLQLRDIGTFSQEGFAGSLTEYYTRQVTLRNKGYILKADIDDQEARDKVVHVVKGAMEGDIRTGDSPNACHQALSYLCSRLQIPLMDAETLSLSCGKSPSLQDIARASNFICRRILLEPDWHLTDCGGIISTLDKEYVACVPDEKGSYILYRTATAQAEPLTRELAMQISPEAYAIGRALPLKPLSKRDVLQFCKKSIRRSDLLPHTLLVIFCSLIGVLLPTLNAMVYDDYIPVGNIGNLTQLSLVMLTFMIGNLSFSIVKNLFGYRIVSRVSNDLQNAVYHRLFHLPESFFRSYDSADLAGRISGIGATAGRYVNTLVLSAISALFSVFYLIRMFSYSSRLTWVSIAVYAVYLAVSVALTSSVRRSQLRISEAESEASSRLYQYLSGVDKLRMAGAEERALLSFMRPYSRQQFEQIRVNRLVSLEDALTSVVSSVFSMVLYWYVVRKMDAGSFSIGSFVAFTSAFGAFTGALTSLVEEGLQLLQENSELARFWPVFQAVPEDDSAKEVPGPLQGGIRLKHVTLAYDKGFRNILTDLSLNIRPGEYVGIVGPSGCGKSTLLKLLLGFESPQSGAVLVDGKDLSALNKGAYRRQLGVVLQNGKLISGSIYENITITAPDATLSRVNEVVRQVGLDKDIAAMPMGLQTMLSENSNTISGGQQQRILIARAICGAPKILIFDEATSALDNLTQAVVSSNLDRMAVTRIVVAHRLSTIKNCDRILVMNEGQIVQEGNYETLMQDRQGLFYALASRQIAQ